jgi:hypothetical protein
MSIRIRGNEKAAAAKNPQPAITHHTDFNLNRQSLSFASFQISIVYTPLILIMHIDGRGWVAVIELVVYIPSLLIALFVCKKHGFTRASGWMYTLILCVVRIAGSICELLTFSNNSISIIKTMIILDSIGLSPLLLATLGMLSRLNDWINARSKGHFGVKQFRIIQLLITGESVFLKICAAC